MLCVFGFEFTLHFAFCIFPFYKINSKQIVFFSDSVSHLPLPLFKRRIIQHMNMPDDDNNAFCYFVAIQFLVLNRVQTIQCKLYCSDLKLCDFAFLIFFFFLRPFVRPLFLLFVAAVQNDS